MGWFDCPFTEEEQLKNQIKLIVNNWENKTTYTITGSGVTINFDKFEIRLETNLNCQSLCNYCYVRFDTKELYSNNNEKINFNWDFLMELAKIVYKKERIKEEENKIKLRERLKIVEEEARLNRQILISNALAEILLISLPKPNKKVVDELSPIFADVNRVKEITSELNQIRKRYSAGGV